MNGKKRGKMGKGQTHHVAEEDRDALELLRLHAAALRERSGHVRREHAVKKAALAPVALLAGTRWEHALGIRQP